MKHYSFRSVVLALVLVWLSFATSASAQTSSWLIYPADHDEEVRLSQPFQWLTVDGAQAYYLYVGTAPGLHDLINTGETQRTSLTVTSLPLNQQLYARIWTKYAGAWTFVDSTFLVPAPPPAAAISYPASGVTNADPAQPISWTAVPGASGYYLYVGSTPGAKDLLNTGVITQTSFSGRTLPLNQTVYARLYTQYDGVWRYTESSFAFQAVLATITSPSNTATNVSPYTAIAWTPVPTADAFYLFVGTSSGAKNVVDTGEIHQTSYQPSLLPAGTTLYIRIWTKSGGRWQFVDSQFTTAPVATLTTPCRGCTDVMPMNVTFTWAQFAGAQAYYLYVGTTLGSHDVVDSAETPQTTWHATLPSAATLYVRLWTKWGNVWRYADSTFTTAIVARLDAPCDGCVNVDPLKAFSWHAVAGADAYVLWVGTASGTHDLVTTSESTLTSYQAAPLPIGQPLFARLWTKGHGVWKFIDSQFTTATVATVSSAAVNATNVDPHAPISWQPVANAQAYYLYVGTTPGAKDLIDTGEISQTSYAPRLGWTDRVRPSALAWDIPASTTDIDGYAIVVDGQRRQIPVPPPAICAGAAASQPCYRSLLPPTAPGSHHVDVVAYNGIGDSPSASMDFDRPGTVVYARLWTKVAGAWHYADTPFTPAPLAAEFTYPAFGATDVDPKRSFTWTTVAGAQAYSLTVGRTPGASDLVSVSDLVAPSYPAASLNGLPPEVPLYARLGTKVDGTWRYTETTFSMLHVAVMSYPADLAHDLDWLVAYSWTSARTDAAYYLYVGTTPGAKDVVDSAEITRPFFIPLNPPPSGVTLYVRLWTRSGTIWRYVDSTFTAALPR